MGISSHNPVLTYQPLNILVKPLEPLMAGRLSDLAEQHNMLPKKQLSGRAGRTTEQALPGTGQFDPPGVVQTQSGEPCLIRPQVLLLRIKRRPVCMTANPS